MIMARKINITFRDLPRRELEASGYLRTQLADLDRRVKRAVASSEETDKRDRIQDVLAYYDAPGGHVPVELVDPLFVAVRGAFNDNHGFLGKRLFNHAAGKLQTQANPAFEDVVKISLVVGLLAKAGVNPPGVILAPKRQAAGLSRAAAAAVPAERIVSDPADPARASFSKAFFAAFGEMQGLLNLAVLTLSILESEGDNNGLRAPSGEVDTVEFASVMRCLHDKGINEREPQLRRRVN